MDKFYRIIRNRSCVDPWYLREPKDEQGVMLDGRKFTDCAEYHAQGPLYIPLREDGVQLDFTFADMEMPVVARAVGSAIRDAVGNACQLIPAKIGGLSEEFFILNILDSVSCIDESKSDFEKWKASDGRPEKIGQYRGIYTMAVDPERAAGHQIFRLKDWNVAIVVAEDIRVLLTELQVTGIGFRPLN